MDQLKKLEISQPDPLDFFSRKPTIVPSLHYYGDRVSAAEVVDEV